MPPLTQCWDTKGDSSRAFGATALQGLAAQSTPDTLREFWRLCVTNQPKLPICQYRCPQSNERVYQFCGPSGAFLVALLATQKRRDLRLWVNDNGERYGQTTTTVPSSESESPCTLSRASRMFGHGGTVDYVLGHFPNTIANCENWLSAGNGRGALVRIGFLDPDGYCVGQAQVTRSDHEQWLDLLRSQGCVHALSLIFSDCRSTGQGNPTLNPRIANFHTDRKADYPNSFVFRHGNFWVGIKVRWPKESVAELLATLRTRIENEWNQWCSETPLIVHVNGELPRG